MIIVLHGPDAYRRDAKKRALEAEFVKKHGAFGVSRFDLEEEKGIDGLKSFLESQSMFSPSKLAIVSNPFEISTKEYANLLKIIAGEKHIAVLLVADSKPPKPFAFLLPKTKSADFIVQEFEYLMGTEWSAFITKESKERSLALAPDAAKLLGTVYAKNAWGLATELDKLALAGTKTITAADVEDLALEIAPNFWEMIGGLKNAQIGTRLKTFARLLAKNEPAAKIFNIIAYQWPEKLAAIANYDLAVKTGKCEYEEVMTDLLLS